MLPCNSLARLGSRRRLLQQAVQFTTARSASGTPEAASSSGGVEVPRLSRQYFAVFGFPVACDVPLDELTLRYRTAQLLIHPDKRRHQAGAPASASTRGHTAAVRKTAGAPLGTSDQLERWTPVLARLNSALANVAYETLRAPFPRFKYLSKLIRANEVRIGEVPPLSDAALAALRADERPFAETADFSGMPAHVELQNVSLPPEFLLALMELNEQVADASGRPAEEATRLQAHIEDKAAECQTEAETAWRAQRDEDFHQAVHRWTYYHNLLRLLRDDPAS